MITRVPRELWETLPSPSHLLAGDPAYQLQDDPRPPSEAAGDERGTKRWYRRAKETKYGERDGKESQHSIVVMKRGNGPSGPRGAKGVPRCRPEAGTTPRASNLRACHREAVGSCEGQRTCDVTSRMRFEGAPRNAVLNP